MQLPYLRSPSPPVLPSRSLGSNHNCMHTVLDCRREWSALPPQAFFFICYLLRVSSAQHRAGKFLEILGMEPGEGKNLSMVLYHRVHPLKTAHFSTQEFSYNSVSSLTLLMVSSILCIPCCHVVPAQAFAIGHLWSLLNNSWGTHPYAHNFILSGFLLKAVKEQKIFSVSLKQRK